MNASLFLVREESKVPAEAQQGVQLAQACAPRAPTIRDPIQATRTVHREVFGSAIALNQKE